MLIINPYNFGGGIPTDGLVAYYPFNGNANDESGNGNNGTVVGATLTNDKNNNENSAYLFDGINDYINIDTIINDLSSLNTGSLSFWIKPTVVSISNYKAIVGFGDAINNALVIHTLSGGLLSAYLIKNSSNKWVLNTNNAVLSQDTWSHIVIIHDGINPKIYVNGQVPSQSFSNSVNLDYWFNDIVIAKGRIGARYYFGYGEDVLFQGIIDDIRIYNRSLSEQEIAQLYNE